jgi:hypothetical protein
MARLEFLGGIRGDRIVSVEIATQETITKGRLALGATGLIFYGPVGILAALLAKKKTIVTFIATYANGSQALLSCPQKEYPGYVRLAMNNASGLPTPAEVAAARQRENDANNLALGRRIASEQF